MESAATAKVSATETTTMKSASSTTAATAVASGPSGVREGDQCDAD
jgi:hypothetical protein